MANYRQDRGSRSGGRGGDRFGNRSFDRGGGGFGGRSSGPAQMFPATCDECGTECEVPFRPTGERPVYCSNCFEKRGEGNRREGRNDNYRDNRRDNRRPSFGENQMFSAICDKCGNECEVPFRPSGDRPVYCRECFGKTEGGRDGGRPSGDSGGSGADMKSLLDEINSKLDKIMRDLGTTKFVRVSSDKKNTEKSETKSVKTDVVESGTPMDVVQEVIDQPKAKSGAKKPKSTKATSVKKKTEVSGSPKAKSPKKTKSK